jgi:hypothetical protein
MRDSEVNLFFISSTLIFPFLKYFYPHQKKVQASRPEERVVEPVNAGETQHDDNHHVQRQEELEAFTATKDDFFSRVSMIEPAAVTATECTAQVDTVAQGQEPPKGGGWVAFFSESKECERFPFTPSRHKKD